MNPADPIQRDGLGVGPGHGVGARGGGASFESEVRAVLEIVCNAQRAMSRRASANVTEIRGSHAVHVSPQV